MPIVHHLQSSKLVRQSTVECRLFHRDGSITMFLNAAVATLFSLVFGSSCHVFIIALQKLR